MVYLIIKKGNVLKVLLCFLLSFCQKKHKINILNLKKKVEENENNTRINEKKNQGSKKIYTQALGELKCVYTKKKWLKFRIKQSSTRGILNFGAKGINILGPWKRSENFDTFVLQQGKRKEFLLLVLYECKSQLSNTFLLLN